MNVLATTIPTGRFASEKFRQRTKLSVSFSKKVSLTQPTHSNQLGVASVVGGKILSLLLGNIQYFKHRGIFLPMKKLYSRTLEREERFSYKKLEREDER